jgi:hypothetical protein
MLKHERGHVLIQVKRSREFPDGLSCVLALAAAAMGWIYPDKDEAAQAQQRRAAELRFA